MNENKTVEQSHDIDELWGKYAYYVDTDLSAFEYVSGRSVILQADFKTFMQQVNTALNAYREELARLQAENAALKEAQSWVPVSERLPELNTSVRVYSITYTNKSGVLRHESETNHKYWSVHGSNLTLKSITHWKPLDTPPTTPNTGNAR